MSNDKDFEELIKEEFDDAEVRKELAVIEGDFKELQPFDTKSIGEMYQAMKVFVRKQMQEGLDYGTIPGTGKRSLYKPGAEKLHTFFGFSVETKDANIIEEWKEPITEDTFPLFHYRYTTKVWNHSRTKLIATCDGEANSYEIKYRWRWVPEHAVPSKYDKEKLESQERLESEFAFAVNKAETTGKYGKPQEYWDSWKADIESGAAKSVKRKARSGEAYDAWERGGTFYRIPNEDIYTQVNTLIKMATKRSYVGAIIIAANASDYFTQDIEDFSDIEASEAISIDNFVPTRKSASLKLIDYAESLGAEDGGEFIKDILDKNNLEFTLDKWMEIVDLVRAQAP
ncbi:MAG: hypothetical protein ACP5D6_09025 [Kosmotogaceae bacterium]